MRVAVSIIWLVLVLGLSLSSFEFKSHIHSMGRYHDSYHLIAFAITTVVLIWSARSLRVRVVASLFALGLAFLTELLEQYRFHNSYEWGDVYTDCGGILIGLVLSAVIRSLLTPRSAQI